MKNIISIRDFSGEQIFEEIVPGCLEQVEYVRSVTGNKRKQDIAYDPLVKVTHLFLEKSTRTMSSYVEANDLLGWRRFIVPDKDLTAMGKGESIANTIRMHAIFNTDILVMRSKIEGAQRFVAEILEQEGYEISVQNAGDGTNQHPTQTFLDLLTILMKLGRLDNFKIGFFGDLKYGRTIHSLLCALAHRKNISVVLVSTPETALPAQYKKLFSNITEGDSLELLSDCHVVYGGRVQEERFEDQFELKRAMGKLKLTLAILNSYRKGVLVMHPMPYTFEITPEIRLDKRVILDNQVWCGIPSRIFCLREGYKNKNEKECKNIKAKCKFTTAENKSLDEYFKERSSRKAQKYFKPIRSGTVIDHIARGFAIKIRGFLNSTGNLSSGVKHLIEDVPSKTSEYKDVLVLENIFLEKDICSVIASISPDVTFNVIRDGVFQKIRATTSNLISGIGKCPNPNCITRNDPEAKAKFHRSPTGDELSCHYCEKEFKREEII